MGLDIRDERWLFPENEGSSDGWYVDGYLVDVRGIGRICLS